jgi:hypothetical protein
MHTLKSLSSKSDYALAEIAKGLNVQIDADNATKKELIDSILEAEGSLEKSADLVKPKKPQKNFARIVMSHQDGVENTKFVKVQVNNEMFTIPREVEVVVPAAVEEVLRNAIALTYHPNEQGVFEERKSRRFPYQVLEWLESKDE